ncbi:MAG TPA: class I SAM-dependent methyltransferase [Solirubrobacterales bacterium]|nr:class I SAM-dependent methyltransferase [Solirubrobacterales bacterium]
MNAGADAEARRTYDAFAASYEDFTYQYMYERWTGRLLEQAEAAGLSGRRLLDVGCGTGLSFISMLPRGFEVTGCDISPAMLELAREKAGEEATLAVADMRELPTFGEFDLVWAVNDSINYLLSVEELEATLAGMRRNLAPGGVIVFDVNTLTAYRSFWSEEVAFEHGDKSFSWSGKGSPMGTETGAIFEARFEGEGEGVEPHVHRQKHFAEPEVLAAIEAAGLRCADVAGEFEGDLGRPLDEEHHTKAVYVCAAARSLGTAERSASPSETA